MFFLNPRAVRSDYPAELAALMNADRAREGRQWMAGWRGLNPGPTPLRELPGLASRLGLAGLSVKDESLRSPLGSFKALGAPVALLREILRRHPGFEPAAVLAGAHADRLREQTVISATDGNHGRALAAAARDIGCPCVIVLHGQVSAEREQAIAALGARIVRIAGDYDASVQEAARLAHENGWQVVSDTSYEGYEDIPRDVMQGYSTLALEALEQSGARVGQGGAFSHVFLQGGVGGLAAGVASLLWEFHGAQRPRFIVVEPAQADCLLQSALQGGPARATGSVDSVMAGLACGETSPLAWRFLQPCVDAFMTVEDAEAVAAMRELARGSAQDIPVLAGESGVAGLAALHRLRAAPEQAAALGLDATSRVLLISTEGATAPEVYARLVGETADSVLRRQAIWQDPGQTAQQAPRQTASTL